MQLTQLFNRIFFIVIFFAFMQCNPAGQNKLIPITKLSATDPFKESSTESQLFTITGKTDNVIEGKNGTRIAIPKGCFKNAKGEKIENDINIELSEALTLDEMILSNLTTTSDGKLLETDGMIFINATISDGEQLSIDEENPIYIEIPTQKTKPGMMAYKGLRDEKGNMNWVEPKELDKFLIPIDMSLLNFYPEGFEEVVEHGMPFRKHKTADKKLTDSLYYSLSVSNYGYLTKELGTTDYNEPYYNSNTKIVNGKYTKESFAVKQDHSFKSDSSAIEKEVCKDCGIDPAIIKAIWNKKFNNTLLSTREFETRLQVIFKTCKNSILENYIKNLDKNLWELDEMTYKQLGENHHHTEDFKKFSEQKLTNVKGAEKYTGMLAAYYEKQLSKIKADLEKIKGKRDKELKKKNQEVEKIADEYRKLLWKREKYRMEKYGFTWTNLGWANIDVPGPIIDTIVSVEKLEFVITNGKEYDQVYSYVVYTSIKSLYRLNTNDKELFYVGNESSKAMWMPHKSPAYAISLGYKGDKKSLAVETFQTGGTKNITLTLKASSTAEIKKTIRQFKEYVQENQIDKDLEYQEYFYKEKVRQKQLWKEEEFIQRLRETAFPCGFEKEESFIE